MATKVRMCRDCGNKPADPKRVDCDDCYREHIARVVAAWPPLTSEQRDRLRLLLYPGEGYG
jgi:hypothetical protein